MGAVVVGLFDWHSSRARRARYGHALGGWVFVLVALSFLLFIGGSALLFIGMSIGWLVLGVIAPLVMVVVWYHHDLHNPKRVINGSRVDDILDADILALLHEQPSPKELAEAVGATSGGFFFAARFGVSGNFLRDLVSDHKDGTNIVFEEALSISRQVGGRVSAGVLVIALLKQLPPQVRQTFLGHLRLNEDDILRGVHWYHSIEQYREDDHQRLLRSGGVGRDWSFGWIPYLSRFGTNISRSGARVRGDVRQEALRQMIEALSVDGGAIALVGKSGTGKTELVYELADTLMYPTDSIPAALRYRQVFLLSASRLLSVSQQGEELGTLVSSLLSEAYTAKNIIVCLDNAELFFQQGTDSVNLLQTLLPIFQAKRLPILLTFDEQQYLQVTKKSPELGAAIRRINVQPTSESDTLKILEEHVPSIEYKYKVTIMYQALKEAYVLGKRYVYDVVMPGQAMSLLEAAAAYAEDGLVTSRSVNRAVEETTGVKTAIADDEGERELLLNLEGRLHERMVGQNKAVSVVSDALRRARAGIRNQNRPVGTFLFLGPTGVGKTELAKSLAEVYFGGEQNLVRLDMNEFVMADDVVRLIADGADNPTSLTAQIMKQPFSVILLDEIEKAHSSVLTTLLQLLDEGILRDERNREVSFRDAIVIATSNAGADRIQEYIQRGYRLEQFEEPFINELIGGRVFHPEFLNRFDEMVVFAPLEKQELFLVVDRIMAGVNKNLEAQNIIVTLTDGAREVLVDEGYDPRLGARPLRRVVQRAVESTVASLLLSGEVTPGTTIELSREQVEGIIQTKRQADDMIDAVKE